MTTIAIKDGLMACDSRVSDSLQVFSTRMPKIYRLPTRALLGCAGEADFRDVIALLSNASLKRLPSRAELAALKCEFSGLLVFPGGTIFFIEIDCPETGQHEWSGSLLECKERFAAVGSGYQFALGAMAAGASAKQAVEIAARFDLATGPPVVEVPLKPGDKPARGKRIVS